MTQGIFINGRRPKSKKEIKEYVDGMYEPVLVTNTRAAFSIVPIEGDDEYVHYDPFGLTIEATSIFGNEFDGSLDKAFRSIVTAPISYEGNESYDPDMEGPRFPQATGITFVGPDPNRSRKFYGQIKWNAKKERFVVT